MNLYLKYEHSPLKKKKKNLVSTGVKMALPVAWWQVLCTDRVERLQYLKIGRGKLLACLWKWNDEIYIPRAKQQMDQTGANERVRSQGRVIDDSRAYERVRAEKKPTNHVPIRLKKYRCYFR